MTPQEFFSKNLKWITLILALLFAQKFIQSCNRNMKLNMTSGQYIHVIDSLEKHINIIEKQCNDSIKYLNFQVKLEKERAELSDKRATSIQETAEKIRANTTTTVNIKGVTIDTTKNGRK